MEVVRHNVLDHGFVELVSVMGDDQAIVDAARVSIAGENVKSAQSNEGLIRYLMRMKHSTPLEMVETKWRCKMPMFVARQWIRHRTANVNELSARYGELPEEYYVPNVEDVKVQATDNKQGRGDETVAAADAIRSEMRERSGSDFAAYKTWLDSGVARELARINLPLSTYTQWIWKIDLHNLFHFLALRLNPHAQMEIRVYAEPMLQELKKHVPIACKAFEDYRLNGMFLSAQDIKAIQMVTSQKEASLDEGGVVAELFPTKREFKEFVTKAEKLTGTKQE